jgi:hypothetical protein
MAKLMGNYSERVLEDVCGLSGICLEQKFMPTLSELKERLDRAEGREQMVSAVQSRRDKQLQERAEYDREMAARKDRPTYEQLIATLPPSLRINKGPLPRITAAEFMASHPHVTKEMLDSCPDADTGTFKAIGNSIPEEPNPFL